MSNEINDINNKVEDDEDSLEDKKLVKKKKKNKIKDDDYDEEEDDRPKKKSKSKIKTILEDEEEEVPEESVEMEEIEPVDAEEDADETDGNRRTKRSLLQSEENVDVEAQVDQEIKKPSNSFAAKKGVAQGMMDIALITANANQLRYMVEYNQHSSTFYVNVVLISLSLILQLAIGMILIYKAWFYMQGKAKTEAAKKLNIYVTAGIFAITIINVFIASFTVTGPAPKDED